MVRLLVVLALCLPLASPAAATQFWLSPFGNSLGSTPPPNLAAVPQLYNFVSQPSGSLYVWATPDAGETLKNWSLRLRSTNASVLDFSTSEVYNPVLVDAVKDEGRWEIVIEPTSNSNVSADFMGITVTNDLVVGKGIGPTTTGLDAYYFGSDAWLLARVDFTPNVVGSTDVFLQIGTLGLNNFGETSEDTTVLFGHVGDTAFADADTDNRHVSIGAADAKIQVLATPDADFNNDTFVTGTDFLIWQRFAGTTSPLNSKGNATYAGDTDINGIDLAAWEFQYGMTIPLGGSLVGGIAVPEPTTLGLAFLVVLVTLTQSSRRGAP